MLAYFQKPLKQLPWGIADILGPVNLVSGAVIKRRLTALRQRVNETWSVKVIFQINADQRKTSLRGII